MDRKELESNVEAAKFVLRDELAATIAKIEKIFDSVITDDIVEIKCDERHASIEIPVPGRTFGHAINIYYDKDWDGGGHKFNLNIGTFGSFDSSMKPEATYYVVAGQLAANLSKMQEMLDAIDFKPLDDARHAYWHACHEFEAFDKAVRDAEEAKKRQDVESKLVAGAKLKVGYSFWDKTDRIDIVERATPKRIYFKFGGCKKKDDVVAKFFDYCQPWSFA